jgi:sugar phosphate isomerase/epimerase
MKNMFTRREMMRRSAGAIAGLVLARRIAYGEPNTPPAPAGSGFKIGACDWTLGRQADPAVFEIAKKVGIDGVQISFNTAKREMHLQKPEIQKIYLKSAEKNGMQISSMAIGELNNIPLKGDDPRAEQWVSESIDACQAMGIKAILVPFFGRGDLVGDEKGTAVIVEKLKKIAPKAEKAGVALAVESYLSAEQNLDIIKKVGSPAIKVYYDVANSQSKGYDICKEIRLLGSHIAEFHAKDSDDLYGKGSINFENVRKAMDDIGYRGWIVMEGSKMPLGLEESNRYDAEYLRKIFPPKV